MAHVSIELVFIEELIVSNFFDPFRNKYELLSLDFFGLVEDLMFTEVL